MGGEKELSARGGGALYSAAAPQASGRPPNMKSFPRCFLASVALAAVALSSARADWPTYLHDATRVGATTEPLATPLHPAWSYTSPVAPATAWAGEGGRTFEGYTMTNRVRFDEVFHTVIAD